VTPRREIRPRLAVTPSEASRAFAADVHYYLVQSPRQLPSRYLYDALGSALFEAICHLPWYGVTRAETGLLASHAADVWRSFAPLGTIVELGSGSGEKLRTLIEGGRPRNHRLAVHLIDVSPSALELSARTLASVEGLHVRAHVATYDSGLAEIARSGGADPTLVLFLGSNIGNFDPPSASALLLSIRAALAPGDGLLMGADLVKPAGQLLAAYDDPLGVTAAFNLNLLIRINRELGGDFDVRRFAHRAVWNEEESRVEMHLVSRSAQLVRIEAADLELELSEHEAIWTESSYKYRPAEIAALLESAGFEPSAQWIDASAQFALTLAKAL
jgi:dimethylhistidine N-methyltransferase